MKDNKYDFLNKLGELDDDEIEMISEEYPFADRHDKLKIARLCEEKLAMKKNMDFDSTDEMFTCYKYCRIICNYCRYRNNYHERTQQQKQYR